MECIIQYKLFMSGVNQTTTIGPEVPPQVVRVFDKEAKETKDNVIAINKTCDEVTSNGASCFTAIIQSPRTGEVEHNSVVCQKACKK